MFIHSLNVAYLWVVVEVETKIELVYRHNLKVLENCKLKLHCKFNTQTKKQKTILVVPGSVMLLGQIMV